MNAITLIALVRVVAFYQTHSLLCRRINSAGIAGEKLVKVRYLLKRFAHSPVSISSNMVSA